jgi:hypothetical protein
MVPPNLENYRERFKQFEADPRGHADLLMTMLHQLYPYHTSHFDLFTFWTAILGDVQQLPFGAQLPIWRSLRDLEHDGTPLFTHRERLDRVLKAWEALDDAVGDTRITPLQRETLIAVFEHELPGTQGWWKLAGALARWCDAHDQAHEGMFLRRLLSEHNAHAQKSS